MLTMVIVLTIASALLEIYICKEFPRLGHWIRAKGWHSLLFSILLSVAIGLVFPAAGLIVMTASLLSTVITQPIYALQRWWASFKTTHLKRRSAT